MRGRGTYVPLFVVALVAVIIAVALILVTGPSVPNARQEWDYIVIGSGAGGAVMAERLSRSGAFSVLLLEAGPNQQDNPLVTEIIHANELLTPTHISELFFGELKTAPSSEPNPPILTGNWLYTGGRCVGGSTSINGAQFVRESDYMTEHWVNLTGDQIWNLTNSLATYIALETYSGTTDVPSHRGTSGPIFVLEEFTTAPQTTPTTMAQKLVQALVQVTNLTPLVDYNTMTSEAEVGPFTSWQLTSFPNGTRCNSPRAFLTAAVLARTNLLLLTSATVTFIRFDTSNRATHVEYLLNGEARVGYARRRIVLCAGINSPTLLQNSGVGPGGYVFNNPNVGTWLYNHQGLVAVFVKNASDVPSANPNDIYEGGAFLPTALNASYTPTTFSPRQFQLVALNEGSVMVTILFNIQPNSSGYVHPYNADPLRIPNVSDQTFVAPYGTVDQAQMLAGVQKYICAMNDAFQGNGSYGPAVDTSYFIASPTAAQCANVTLLAEFVSLNTIVSAHHWVASNRMGVCGDGVAVTNGRGSVCGVTGLTIADASLVPAPTDGNTQAPAYLIGSTLGGSILAGEF